MSSKWFDLAESLPDCNCQLGYPKDQLEVILDSRIDEFLNWMYDLPRAVCDGLICDGPIHGTVIYKDDLYRFLRGLPI